MSPRANNLCALLLALVLLFVHVAGDVGQMTARENNLDSFQTGPTILVTLFLAVVLAARTFAIARAHAIEFSVLFVVQMTQTGAHVAALQTRLARQRTDGSVDFGRRRHRPMRFSLVFGAKQFQRLAQFPLPSNNLQHTLPFALAIDQSCHVAENVEPYTENKGKNIMRILM